MSQSDLAERLEMSRQTLIKIEKGERPLHVMEKTRVKEVFNLIGDNETLVNADLRINIPQKKLKIFKQVLLYILSQVGGKPNVGQTVLFKLLYFIDFDYYEKYEEQLMGLTYIKNHYGPTPKEFIKVIEEMKHDQQIEELQSKYFKYEQRKYLPLIEPDLSSHSARDIKHIDEVLERLADKSARELSDYSHGDLPWLAHEENEEIDYESVFYRNEPYSVRQYTDDL